MQPLRCAGCRQPIEGQYLNALGKAWHPACFTCAACGQPIRDQYATHAGRALHPACYAAHHAPRCGYCGEPLTGRYLVDSWGTPFHAEHKQAFAACTYCGRLEPHIALTRKTRAQTIRCAACALSAVETEADAAPLVEAVIAHLAADGVRLRDRLWRLRLLPEAAFVQLDDHRPGRMGVTHSTATVQGRKTHSVTIDYVAIVAGLPRVLCEAVLAHEVGHVWLIQHGVRGLARRDEEGFCELLAHRRLTAIGGVEADVYARAIASNPDPVYGDGYRALAALNARHGFAALVETLRGKRRLPV